MTDLQLDDFKTDENAAMVLLVDDQAMIGEAVRRGLSNEENIDFHFCSDPHQAIAHAIRIKPTVILQDLVMPGLDGLSLVREYRNHPATKDIPIIVLSTKEDPLIKSAAFAAGANDYLVKLPDNIELVARIRYHSRSYMTLLQRDAAYRALRVSQQQLLDTNLVLQRLMNSDGLTGLSNRRHFDEYLELEWRRSLRDQSQLSLLMIDVDYFKSYNDCHGHSAGDECLALVGKAVGYSLQRPADLVARYGGDEFVVLLPITDTQGALDVAQRVLRAIYALDITHGASPFGRVTSSIGVAQMVPRPNSKPQELLERADRALYAAKQAGRNTVMAEPAYLFDHRAAR